MRRLALLVLLTPSIVFAQPAERQVVIAISEPTPARPNPRLPDVARAGGRVQTRWQNLYLIALPNASVPAAITGWRRDEHVRFVQKIWDGESLESWNTAAGPRRETTATETTQPDGTLLWSSGIYSYDGSGNIKSIGSDSYRYDAVGRITRSTLNGSTEEYGYDGFGNLTSKYVVGETSALPAASPGTNQIAAATYDAAGNLTQHGSFTYAYDAAGMMTYENAAFGPTRHIYTADDERIMMVQGAPPHLSAHITIRDFAGRVQRRWHEPAAGWPWVWTEDYIYREDRVAARAREAGDGERGFLHLDHLGSVRLITDINGTKLARHDYYPFGTEQTSLHQEYQNFGYNPERVKFTSHERDYNGAPVAHEHSYLDYMHARFYSPKWGRFLSVDPTWESADLRRPQSWNRYAYVENNPVNLTDPDGKCPFCVQLAFEFATDFITDGSPTGSSADLPKDPAQRTAYMRASRLELRAKEIHSALPEATQRRTTTAVAEVTNPDGSKQILVASSEKNLRPSQRAALRPGEVAVVGKGHAEQTIIDAAKAGGQKVDAVAASRPICPSCATGIRSVGARAASSLKKVLKDIFF